MWKNTCGGDPVGRNEELSDSESRPALDPSTLVLLQPSQPTRPRYPLPWKCGPYIYPNVFLLSHTRVWLIPLSTTTRTSSITDRLLGLPHLPSLQINNNMYANPLTSPAENCSESLQDGKMLLKLIDKLDRCSFYPSYKSTVFTHCQIEWISHHNLV